MRLQSYLFFSLCLVVFAATLVSIQGPIRIAQASKPRILSVSEQRIIEKFGKLPLRFEANQGQTDPEVQFLAKGPGYALFLTPTEAVIRLQEGGGNRGLAIRRPADFLNCQKPPCLPLRGRGGLHGQSAQKDRSTQKVQAAQKPELPEGNSVVRMKLVGANPAATVRGIDKLPGASNYFIGNDPARWHTQVPAFAKVGYEQVYPGIDLVYYGNPQRLEYDFVLRPGANPGAIRMDIQGADNLDVDVHGDLVLGVSGRQIRLQTPAVYQEMEGKRKPIAGHYVLRGEHQVGFEVAAYDRRSPLTIDPVLLYATYLGGSATTNSPAIASTYNFYGAGVAVDSSGNAYITGYTTSNDFPLASPAQQSFNGSSEVFVAKFNPAGSALLYSTYLGGINGDQDALGIAVDSGGNAYVAGFTNSPSFPTTPGAYRTAPYSGITTAGETNAFVSKINAAGSTLGYSTYLGGNGNNGYGDAVFGIAVDSGGNAYVAGLTSSTNFPTVNAYQGSLRNSSSAFNAFVTKIFASGAGLAYSTYLGGNDYDYAISIAVDSSGNAYVTGATESTNFPVSNGAFEPYCGVFPGDNNHNCDVNEGGPFPDSFVTKVNASGNALAYSTYLGGSYENNATAIAVDSAGDAYIAGSTNSPDFPASSGALLTTFHSNTSVPEGFVTEMNPAGTHVVFSTFLGGSASDAESGVAVDSSGNVYVAGTTTSSDFPMAGQPFQPTYGGGTDAVVAELAPGGASLVYSSYIGGSLQELALGIAVDPAGSAYVTGFTSSLNFPTANPFQANLSGTGDAFLVKIRGAAAGGPSISNNGVVNGASFAPGAPLAAGSIASVFGSSLASSNPNGTVLTLNGISAPLYYVGATQINFQVPWELAGQSQATLTVTVDGNPSNPVPVSLASFGPGVFTLLGANGSTVYGAVVDVTSGLIAAPVGSIAGVTSQPASRGDFITIYCTGLGAVSSQPLDGVPASASPLSNTSTIPFVTVSASAAVSFSGLTPGYFGLYQINAQIPQNALTGAVPLQVQIGGLSSNIVTIAVQ